MRQFAAILIGIMVTAALVMPAAARPAPVTIWVNLVFQVPTDGPNLPPKVVTYPIRVDSVAAAKSLCSSRSSLGKLATYFKRRNISLQRYLDGESGECVMDKSGEIKMVIDTSPSESK